MSMEGRLFFVSIWCGVYGQLLRSLFKQEKWLEKKWVVMVLNSLFWATFSAMVGMLLASYSENLDQTTAYATALALAGLVIGAFIGYRKAGDEAKKSHLLKDNLEWADTGFSAILLASLVMFFVIQAFKIPSGSMRMTFVEGDHLFVNKFIYGIRVPLSKKKFFPLEKVKQKDIVIFRFPSNDKKSMHYGKDFIKRVIALPGQTVEIKNKAVFVDGVKLNEPYKQHVGANIFSPSIKLSKELYQRKWAAGLFARIVGNEIRDNFGPVVVPENNIFVMGDNRDRSFDSRFWGPLPLDEIKGKAWLIYWPFQRVTVVH